MQPSLFIHPEGIHSSIFVLCSSHLHLFPFNIRCWTFDVHLLIRSMHLFTIQDLTPKRFLYSRCDPVVFHHLFDLLRPFLCLADIALPCRFNRAALGSRRNKRIKIPHQNHTRFQVRNWNFKHIHPTRFQFLGNLFHKPLIFYVYGRILGNINPKFFSFDKCHVTSYTQNK